MEYLREAKLEDAGNGYNGYELPGTVGCATDTMDYIPTQYVAEYVKYLQYDGIVYRSSLVPEVEQNGRLEVDSYNAVIFNYEKCKPIKSNVFLVTGQHLECEQVDDDKDEKILSVMMPLLKMSY